MLTNMFNVNVNFSRFNSGCLDIINDLKVNLIKRDKWNISFTPIKLQAIISVNSIT